MIQKINNTATISARLDKEGKVTVLNDDIHVRAIENLNLEMEEVRKDYKVKNQNSQNSAALTILT
ncbi:MAG TPA: hypothetical protein VLB84_05915 [Bacteroidia bacterium]|nr:hypothetical protein [Bacteroidia bacterium]